MPIFKLGVLASSVGADVRSAITEARRLGFSGLLFDAFASDVNFGDLSATGRREFRRIVAGQDEELIGLRVDLGPKGFGPGADVDRLLHQFTQVLEAAAGLATPLICADVGLLPEPVEPVKPRPVVTPEQAGLIILPGMEITEFDAGPTAPPPDPAFVSQVDSALRELGAIADRFSVAIAMHSELSSLAASARALSAAHCPWFGVDLDPVSILRDRWEPDRIFSELGRLIRHVRGRDAIAGADKRTKPASIGRGDTKWDQLLDNLQAADYHGWITLEATELPERSKAVVAGLKYLKMHE